MKITYESIEALGAELLLKIQTETGSKYLEGATVEACNKLTRCAGMAYYSENRAAISAPIFVRSQNERALRDTILHEIAHLMTPGAKHGDAWYEMARSIGCSGRQYHHEETGPGLGVQLSKAIETPMNKISSPDESGVANFAVRLLSDETETKFTKPKLGKRDYLFIWLNDAGDKFICETRAYKWYEEIVPGDMHQEYVRELRVVLNIYNEPQRPSYAGNEMLRELPGARHLSDIGPKGQFKWVLPTTDFTALLINELWPRDRIVFGRGVEDKDEEAELMFTALVKRFLAQTGRASRQARFKTTGELTPVPKDWRTHEILPLSDCQQEAVMFAQGFDGTALFMDKGTGKTATAIQSMCMSAMRHKNKTGKMFRVLLAVPNQARTNWLNEILRFAVCPGKVAIMRGDKRTRIQTFVQAITTEDDCNFSAMIAGYDSLSGTADELVKMEWDLMICDESHFFKSHRTNRWKSVKRLAQRSRQRIALTGTPIGNSPMDLYTQLEFLSPGLSGFSSFKSFREFYGQWEGVEGAPQGVQRLTGLQYIPLLKERLTRLSFQVTKKEAGLNLPEKTYDVYEVEMTPAQKSIYASVASKIISEVEDQLSGETTEVEIQNALVKLLRLAQITSGHLRTSAVFNEDGDMLSPAEFSIVASPNPKTEACIDIIRDEPLDGKIIIWAWFVPDIENLCERLTKEGIKHVSYYGATSDKQRDINYEQFNCDPETRVIVCNPKTAGEALTLLGYDWANTPDDVEVATHTSRVIYYSQNWSSLLRSQSEDRPHRRGTRREVQYTDLQCPGTIDVDISNVVNSKLAMASSVLDVREILTSVAGNL